MCLLQRSGIYCLIWHPVGFKGRFTRIWNCPEYNIKKGLSLSIVNEGLSLTIVNETRRTIVSFSIFCRRFHNETIAFQKERHKWTGKGKQEKEKLRRGRRRKEKKDEHLKLLTMPCTNLFYNYYKK